MPEELPAMSSKKEPLVTRVNEAVKAGQLQTSTAKNISMFLRDERSPCSEQTIAELVATEQWGELNDRFYKTLAFGTGGLRGRTIGKIVTKAERGEAGENERPQLPCVGTNAMNFFNVRRATEGLVAYLHEIGPTDSRPASKARIPKRPKIVIACDSRHFSKEFTELAAKTAAENACDACPFD